MMTKLDNRFSCNVLTVDLAAIKANYEFFKAKHKKHNCFAVVKADAYGLGAERVAPYLYDECGVRGYFVASLDEGLLLRKHLKQDAKIYVLHGVGSKEQAKSMLANDIYPVLNSANQVSFWQNLAKEKQRKLPAIIHIDTGINRMGFYLEDAMQVDFSGILPEYIMTHPACASEPEHEMNKSQLDLFKKAIAQYKNIPASFCNSAGVLLADEYHFDMARVGCGLYGINPLDFCHAYDFGIKRVVHLKSSISQIRKIDSLRSVGYGAAKTLAKDSLVAVVPLGYADGYFRALGDKASCVIAGYKLPVIGRVSMDLITLDITNLPEKHRKEGAEVEVIGNNITVNDLAKHANTIGYEICVGLGDRFRKKYIG